MRADMIIMGNFLTTRGPGFPSLLALAFVFSLDLSCVILFGPFFGQVATCPGELGYLLSSPKMHTLLPTIQDAGDPRFIEAQAFRYPGP